MADTSAISWTDSTFNPWIGCTKVGPGCDNCYAERDFDIRKGVAKWGAGQQRVRTKPENWHKPVAWNAQKFYECLECGARFAPPKRGEGFVTCPSCSPHRGHWVQYEDEASRVKDARRRVFCASLADVFDNEVDQAWRVDLLELIAKTPNLDWLLLTKRIGNVHRLLDDALSVMSHGLTRWGDAPWPNVWIGATVVNQEEADRDIPKLLAVPARVRFLSIEPMLGPVRLDECAPYTLDGDESNPGVVHAFSGHSYHPRTIVVAPPTSATSDGIHWVIAGGESGTAARPSHPDWYQSLRDQCAAAGVPFHFKQWGEWVYDIDGMARVGKAAAGRKLDGVEHNGFPVVA